jgi:antitoxin (DNA-binding transcriptional repressor) of toxin-antitoxin stability system
MSAAPADGYEYEVPPHGPAPAAAVEAAEGGQLVYLTRAGRRIAMLESAEQRFERLQAIAEFWRRREDDAAAAAREVWEAVVAAGADEGHRQRVREVIDRIIQQAEDAADAAAADAALADPAPSIPANQVWAELGSATIRDLATPVRTAVPSLRQP